MSGKVGRSVLVKKNSVTLAGVRTTSLSFNSEPINLTTGENNGKRLLAAEAAEETVSISVEGLLKDSVLLDIALGSGSKLLTDLTFENPIFDSGTNSDEGDLAGDFYLASFEEGAPYNDAITFSATFESSGAWTWDPESVS